MEITIRDVILQCLETYDHFANWKDLRKKLQEMSPELRFTDEKLLNDLGFLESVGMIKVKIKRTSRDPTGRALTAASISLSSRGFEHLQRLRESEKPGI